MDTPLGRKMRQSADAWAQAAEAVRAQPNNIRAAATLTIQVRNLAAALEDAGIEVSPSNLMINPRSMPADGGKE
jgi:hypothetical protein